MALTDGKLSAPSPLAISVLLVLGGIIWAVEKAWELLGSVFSFLFGV